MNDREFNLLDEKWILVRRNDCTVEEISLTNAVLRAHEYVDLAGELPTQDVSILRLMLALLHTIFSRYLPDGEKKPLERPQDALRRWSELWHAGRFPEKPVREYLESGHERFWLFHPERPFYQTMAAKVGTEYTASKLNGAVSESSNKVRLFSGCSGRQKSEINYPEAARWLLYVNNYDDTSAKPKGKNLPSPGAGWLGKLGLITVRGNNLFETLMYNLILLNPTGWSLWETEKPVWELDTPRGAERTEIAAPDNLSELYTLQSRRLYLVRAGEKVTGYTLLGGDFFDKVDAFIEPMTIWSAIKGSERTKTQFQPRRHDSSVQMWREFSATFAVSDMAHIPGIVLWIEYLRKSRLIDRQRFIRFSIASVQYGDKDFFVNDLFSDSITFHTDLLTELGKHWQTMITNEIANCDELTKAVSTLARRLELAAGSSDDTAGKRASVGYAREQFYYEIDVPFREWLASIDPNWGKCSDEESEALKSWHDTAKMIAASIGKDLVESAGTAAIVGRMGKDEKGNDRYYSAADAYRSFRHGINSIYFTGGEQ